MRVTLCALLFTIFATLYVTNPVGRASFGLGVDWAEPPPPAVITVDDYWVLSLGIGRGNRGRPDRHWVGIAGSWHRIPWADASVAITRKAFAELRVKAARLTSMETVAVAHAVLFAVASPQVWGAGGLLGGHTTELHFVLSATSWRRPWTLVTSQLLILDFLTLATHISLLLVLDKSVGVKLGDSKVPRVYFGCGVAYILSQRLADRLFRGRWIVGSHFGPDGCLIGTTAGLIGANTRAWTALGTRMSVLGVELLNPESVLMVLVLIHLFQTQLRGIAGVCGAIGLGYQLGTFYGATWKFPVIGLLDNMLTTCLDSLYMW